MPESISQDQVMEWIKTNFTCIEFPRSEHDNRGPDGIFILESKCFYVEAIGFNDNNKGKNQSDFWKAFAQAIARINPQSPWGKADKVVIALPSAFLPGWSKRVNIHGQEVWSRIGNAFPELEIWFVSNEVVQRFSWNDAFSP